MMIARQDAARGREELLPVTVAQKVRHMIVQNQMQPGDRLPTEAELSHSFGVSRSTLREAMKILRAENVVVIRQGSGTFVSDWTGVGEDPLGLHFTDQEHLIDNLFEARLLIDPQIAMLAVQRATPQNIRDLKEIIDRMQETPINDENAAKLDIQFHTAVAECTHNDVLIRVIPIINESIVRSHRETSSDAESYRRSKRSHRGIYEAIVNGDILTAKYMAERHVWETLSDVHKMEEEKR